MFQILYWFERLKLSEIVRLTLPAVYATALKQIADECTLVRAGRDRSFRG